MFVATIEDNKGHTHLSTVEDLPDFLKRKDRIAHGSRDKHCSVMIHWWTKENFYEFLDNPIYSTYSPSFTKIAMAYTNKIEAEKTSMFNRLRAQLEGAIFNGRTNNEQ